ncbi:uncharacterized protein LOC111562553 [Amphiprion ocellaris]|nr:uncharacterized protein LOC111562553 [Amphiprion ocellaris]
MAHETTLKQSPLHFKSTNVGDSVTLECFCQDEALMMFYWYKQTLGMYPKLVSTFYKHSARATFQDEFNNPQRFSLDATNDKNHLTISDLRISDSGSYYCVISNFYTFTFYEGTFLSVKGSGLNIKALVHQSNTIQPGQSVNCTVHTGTCDGEHSVYWFKNSEDSHPGLIYSQGGRSDQCTKKDNRQTQTCVYSLPINSLNLSHTGTYYCAVASCGRILFGSGTKLDTETGEVSISVLVYLLGGALAFTTILIVLLAVSVYKMSKRPCQCTDSNVTSSARIPVSHHEEEENLHYAVVRNHKTIRSRGNTDSECVYSSVRQ